MKAFDGKNVLIVDDEELMREILRDEFLRCGAAVCHEAANGGSALAMAKKTEYQIIVSDIRMPHGDGLQLLSEVIKLPVRPMLFLCSGYSDLTREEALRKGARDLYAKPFDPETLVDAIRKSVFR